MKRIIATIMLCLAATTSSYANTIKVPSAWGFAAGSTQGSYVRAIFEQASKNQKKYEFIFEHKPGAGGSIAAQYVINQPQLSILASSSAFFIRPNLYSNNSYSVDQFKPIMLMGVSPGVLVTKNKTLDQILSQSKITIATAGAGSSTHLMAEAFVKNFKNKEIIMVHYKDTIEAFTTVMGGHVDMTFEFLGDAQGRATAETKLIGITGTIPEVGVPTLSSLGYRNMEYLSAVLAIYAPAKVSDEQIAELQTILLTAEKSPEVQLLYKRDYVTKSKEYQQPGNLTPWFNRTKTKFRELTLGMKVE
jgi:tripartite-type tricarboxylate transporter receptor subunit TctC